MTLVVTPGTGQTIDTLNDLEGSAGASNAKVLSVQGIASGTALPVSAAALPLPTGAATEASLASVKTAVETVAGAVDATKVKAKTADGDDAALGAKADAAATTDAGTFSLIGLFKRLLERVTTLVKAAGQAAMAASHPVVIASDQSAVSVKTGMAVVSQEITRPADTAAYAANDVVGPTTTPAVGVLADLFSENGGTGYISKVKLVTNQAANTASYRIYFYNVAPTAIADNAVSSVLYADDAKIIGYVDIANTAQEGTGSDAAIGLWTGQLAAKAAAADNDLYYVIITKTAFTPANGQKFTVTVTLDRNG
jgi:hypothetical protein